MASKSENISMPQAPRNITFSANHSVQLKDHSIPDIDCDQTFLKIFDIARNYSMTDKPAMFALYSAMEYVLKRNIAGHIVECGVWRGGSALMASLILKMNEITEKSVYLYDTYEGMSEPTKHDIDMHGNSASSLMQRFQDDNGWCYASIEDVKKTFVPFSFEFDINFIKGDVLQTIPSTHPDKISLLRLDTDWYESTLLELELLYPKLTYGGVLIIDDYGHWSGARKAVDEYFTKVAPPLLIRINNSVRLAIKI